MAKKGVEGEERPTVYIDMHAMAAEWAKAHDENPTGAISVTGKPVGQAPGLLTGVAAEAEIAKERPRTRRKRVQI